MEILKKKLIKFGLILISVTAGLALFITIGNNLANVIFPVDNNIKIEITKGKIGKGSSLYTTLIKDFSVIQTVTLGRRMDEVYNTRKIKPGDKYKIYHSTFGKILKFEYSPEPLKKYVLKSTGTDFIPEEIIPDYTIKKVAVKGSIKSSLYSAMVNSGVDVGTIMSFAKIFQWQVDFLTEVRPDDKFLLVFNKYFIDGKPVESGEIVMAAYKGKVGNYTAVRFKDGNIADYYNADGDSLRKQFLKAPLSFSRISSKFTYHRMHPILRYVRPHLAIDYAAPSGTPISSVASGKVIYKGWKGGYGRTVIVKHNSIYTTQYGHMRAYGRGIRVGKYIKQNAVVGYVGMSGLATGPHLDFKITKYGKPVNYVKLKFPPSKSGAKKNMAKFGEKVEAARKNLEIMQSDYFADSPVPLFGVENKG
ncbi:MAG: M23 family metallopeptidase [Elusimicrobia bacterium]|nr:M23 family metallopeptidase [Elusimicrobiota bacterium]